MTAGNRMIPPASENTSSSQTTRRISKKQIVLLAGFLVCAYSLEYSQRQTRALLWTRPPESIFAAPAVTSTTASRNESREAMKEENMIPNEISLLVRVEISNVTKQVENHPQQEWTWQCCVDPLSINSMPTHPYPHKLQAKNYSCPTTPSNFSWYFGPPPPTHVHKNMLAAPASSIDKNYALDGRKWRNASYTFVGGSTTRQMHEQLLWEMPEMKSKHNSQLCLDRYMFKHIANAPYSRSHVIDLRQVAPCLKQALEKRQERTNYVIFSIGPWWFTPMVGTVIDPQGLRWSISGGPKWTTDQEWEIDSTTAAALPSITIDAGAGANHQTSPASPPNVTFAGYIERVVKMMLRLQSPNTVLVYRSESHSDCDPVVGSSYRGTVTEVLTKYNIPVLNISRAACLLDTAQRQGWHVCFPSVGLRHWILQFQRQFLDSK